MLRAHAFPVTHHSILHGVVHLSILASVILPAPSSHDSDDTQHIACKPCQKTGTQFVWRGSGRRVPPPIGFLASFLVMLAYVPRERTHQDGTYLCGVRMGRAWHQCIRGRGIRVMHRATTRMELCAGPRHTGPVMGVYANRP